MKGNRAFTLIELLVVIASIAILASILFTVFAQARERRAICGSRFCKSVSALAVRNSILPISMGWRRGALLF